MMGVFFQALRNAIQFGTLMMMEPQCMHKRYNFGGSLCSEGDAIKVR
jgi:hypothetical protein